MRPGNRVFTSDPVAARVSAGLLSGDDAIFHFLWDAVPQGVWPGARVGNNSQAYVNFIVPPQIAKPIRVFVTCVPRFTGTDKDIDLHSEYSADGEPEAQHAQDDVTSTYDFTAGVQQTIEVTNVFSFLSAGDRAALELDHKIIGGSIDYRNLYLVGG